MQPFDSIERLERAKALDRPIQPIADAVQRLVRPQAVRDALHGVWLGHPLHPALVQVPVGAWASAGVLDLLPGTRVASRVLIATGLASAGPAALAGWVDWSEAHEEQRRVGLVHAVANLTGVALYAASLRARLRGREVRGRLLGGAGLGAVLAGGVLGGHLAYRQATGANHAEDAPHVLPEGWAEVTGIPAAGELLLGTPVRARVGDDPVVVVRREEQVHILTDRCSHLSGPLSEGELSAPEEAGGAACIVCPWHGSTFRLADGAVVHGPATASQPVFDVRADGDRLLARLRR